MINRSSWGEAQLRTTANPEVIAWALERAGKTPEELKSVSSRVQEWIDGKGKPPTRKQLEKLAKATHVLLPYFYADSLPDLALQIPDYRTLDSERPSNPSPELYDVVNQMLSRQDWLADYLGDDDGEELAFVGCCAGMADANACAAIMRRLLQLNLGWARGMRADEAVRCLRGAIERAGVYVCAGSYFGNSTRRAFKVEEFRGFVLADKVAPIIFLNTADVKSAQLFTLAHEFAHLLFNESGVDDVGFANHDRADEDLCDSVAAEFLVPAALVHELFDESDHDHALDELRRLTCTSTVVCLRRALDLGRMSKSEFFDRYRSYKNQMAEVGQRPSTGAGGPTFYAMVKNHLGSLFTDTVYSALKSDRLLYADAYKLTGMSAKSFSEYFRREGMYV